MSEPRMETDCPECGETIEAPDYTDGQEFNCPNCDTLVMVSCDSESDGYFVVVECDSSATST